MLSIACFSDSSHWRGRPLGHCQVLISKTSHPVGTSSCFQPLSPAERHRFSSSVSGRRCCFCFSRTWNSTFSPSISANRTPRSPCLTLPPWRSIALNSESRMRCLRRSVSVNSLGRYRSRIHGSRSLRDRRFFSSCSASQEAITVCGFRRRSGTTRTDALARALSACCLTSGGNSIGGGGKGVGRMVMERPLLDFGNGVCFGALPTACFAQ